MKSHRYWIWAVLLVISLGTALIFLKPGKKQSGRFFDGTRFELAGVSYGSNHVFVPDGLWDKIKTKVVPTNGFKFAGLNIQRPTPMTLSGADNYLIVWLYHHKPSPAPGGFSMMGFGKIVDDTGLQVGSATGTPYPNMGITGSSNRAGFYSLWLVQSFPRRAREFTMEIYKMDSGTFMPQTNQASIKLRIKNPEFREQFPTWKAEPLPASHKVGPVEVVLEECKETKPAFYHPMITGHTVETRLKLISDPSNEEGWQIQPAIIRDATGNSMAVSLNSGFKMRVGNTMTFQSVLDPREVWEMECRVYQTKKFKDEELWTVTIPGGPGPGNARNFGKETAHCYGNLSGNIIILTLQNLPAEIYPHVVEVRDGDGKMVQTEQIHQQVVNSGTMMIQLQVKGAMPASAQVKVAVGPSFKTVFRLPAKPELAEKIKPVVSSK